MNFSLSHAKSEYKNTICIQGSNDHGHLKLSQWNEENVVSLSDCQDQAGNAIVQKPRVGWKVPGRLHFWQAGLGADGHFWLLSLLVFTTLFCKV